MLACGQPLNQPGDERGAPCELVNPDVLVERVRTISDRTKSV